MQLSPREEFGDGNLTFSKLPMIAFPQLEVKLFINYQKIQFK